jgi:hypothetical protein
MFPRRMFCACYLFLDIVSTPLAWVYKSMYIQPHTHARRWENNHIIYPPAPLVWDHQAVVRKFQSLACNPVYAFVHWSTYRGATRLWCESSNLLLAILYMLLYTDPHIHIDLQPFVSWRIPPFSSPLVTQKKPSKPWGGFVPLLSRPTGPPKPRWTSRRNRPGPPKRIGSPSQTGQDHPKHVGHPPIVGYSTSSVTQHRRLLNFVGDSTWSTLSTIEKMRLIKQIQDY